MQIKQGDTFLLALVVKVDGVAQDLTNWQVHSSIGAGLVNPIPLIIDYTDRANGAFTLSGDTSDWPTGFLYFDIRYVTDSAQVVTTESVRVQVVQGVTRT